MVTTVSTPAFSRNDTVPTDTIMIFSEESNNKGRLKLWFVDESHHYCFLDNVFYNELNLSYGQGETNRRPLYGKEKKLHSEQRREHMRDNFSYVTSELPERGYFTLRLRML